MCTYIHTHIYSVCLYMCVCVYTQTLTHTHTHTHTLLLLFSHSASSDSFVISWTVDDQASLSIDFPGNNTEVGCHDLLQGIFKIQVSKLHRLLGRQILYPLSHQGHTYIHREFSQKDYIYIYIYTHIYTYIYVFILSFSDNSLFINLFTYCLFKVRKLTFYLSCLF